MTPASQAVLTAFLNYKANHSMQTFEEAAETMHDFMDALKKDKKQYSPVYKSMLLGQCKEVLAKVKELPFPKLTECQVREWFITPAGVALVRNTYQLNAVSEDELDGFTDWACPCDYRSVILASSADNDILPVDTFVGMLGIPYSSRHWVLQHLPNTCYTGTLTQKDELRISLSATLYLASQTEKPPANWPHPCATKTGIRLA